MGRQINLRRRFQVAAILFAAAFLVVAALVVGGRAAVFDLRVLGDLRARGMPGEASWPAAALGVVQLLTWAGAWWVRLIVALGASAVLVARERAREGVVLVLSCTLGALLLPVFKQLFGRARPELAWRLTEVTGASFPSGHAFGAAILYPMAGFMLGRMARGLNGGLAGLVGGLLLAIPIGGTRVVLGVHWLSDVAAGWLLGAAWTCAALALVVRGQRRDGAIKHRIAPGAALRKRRRDG